MGISASFDRLILKRTILDDVYSLETKINALDRLDRHDGNFLLISESLGIPERTLERWREREKDLRRRWRQRQKEHLAQLKLDLQVKMLRQAQKILAQMDDETLTDAPLNQLTAALNALANQMLKLEEATDDSDGQQEYVTRFEYYYDGQAQAAPPWASASVERPSAVQGSRLRPAMGQDGVGQDPAAGANAGGKRARLVAGADPPDGQPSLARPESDRQKRPQDHD